MGQNEGGGGERGENVENNSLQGSPPPSLSCLDFVGSMTLKCNQSVRLEWFSLAMFSCPGAGG